MIATRTITDDTTLAHYMCLASERIIGYTFFANLVNEAEMMARHRIG